MKKDRLLQAILNNETHMDYDSLSRNTSLKDVEKLLQQQNHKCKNNPIQKAIGVPESYVCPQWKYNQGYLEKDDLNNRYLFDIDHINDYSESKDNSFENKQILCLYCHRMKTNYRKKYKSLTALEVNEFKPQSMEID
jgi:CRISPR/Cas system Type II protein with McrA/HNH and RuvC-like nuclease domain